MSRDATNTAGDDPSSTDSSRGDVLRLRRNRSDGTLRLRLESGSELLHEVTIGFRSPVQNSDAEEARWLLEDHPRLRGRAADPIAKRVEGRLRTLASELRAAVFETIPETQPIVAVLGDGRRVAQLRMVVEEPADAPWTPWELLLAPGSDQPLSIRVAAFSRHADTTSDGGGGARLAKHGAGGLAGLRVLLVTSRPAGEDDVPFRSVASRMVQTVAANPTVPVRIEILRPPTYPALRAALAAAAAAGAPFDVVHFDGHGGYPADPLRPEAGRGALWFEDEGGQGGVDAVPGDLIGEDLVECGVRYLVLNACRSGYAEPHPSGEAEGDCTRRVFGSLAAEVQAAGVHGVLAMGFNLYVVTAARFVADTYAALAAGFELARAAGHARRRLYSSEAGREIGVMDWLVPVVLQDVDLPGAPPMSGIPELPVRVSSTTPASERVIDPDAEGTARSDARAFFGYDPVLLRLDRAGSKRMAAELVGLTGSGKSAVAAEFARWWAATTRGASVILDVGRLETYAQFLAGLESRLAAARAVAPAEGGLLVLDGAGDVLEAGGGRWTEADRSNLLAWLASWPAVVDALVLTGRVPSGVEGIETIVLTGLDTEARAELAAENGFGPAVADAMPGLLPWSHGVPAVVIQLARIAESVTEPGFAAVRRLLFNLRSGMIEPSALELTLLEQTGMRIFDVRSLRRAVLPIALCLFQGFVADHEWHFFCLIAAQKGLDLARGEKPVDVLAHEFRAAEREGLVTRVPRGYLLHPLAPLVTQPGFAGTVHVLTHGDDDQRRALLGLCFVSYIQSVTVDRSYTEAMTEAKPGGRANDGLGWQGENLWNAVELATSGWWWGLALPLLHRLRDWLREEARDGEWREILGSVLAEIQKHPPEEREMGPENAALHLIRFAAEEAEHDGDLEQVKRLRAMQLRLACAEEVVVEPVDPGHGKTLDVGRIRRISAFLKNGDAAARENSKACLALYNEALRLSKEAEDELRAGEVELAIAKAHLNVATLRDPVKYEEHARRARDIGQSFGQFGRDLTIRASVSLGNAIMEQIRASKTPEPARCLEARDAFEFVLSESTAGLESRANAHHGLGSLLLIQGQYLAAADEYLAASNDFAGDRDPSNAATARTLAARALTRGGRLEDAQNLAVQVLVDIREDEALVQRLLPALEGVLAAGHSS